ncbi:uncharacterized protein LOC114170263 [Vigna unguiculata]|uniref:uncharacterized protein LOC114170263 n=1 Tax=Vigna unguiculata TaxID=3917 RepID=UPI0010160661|nr:uncharacterized protein LOC114170263 [Vigna unguiculata]
MTVQEYVNKFEHLARHELKRVVTPLRERRFPVLVEQAKSAEDLEKGPGPVVSRHRRNVAEARQMKKSYSRPQTSQGPTCYQCGRPHLKRNCLQLTGGVGGSSDRRKCFICDKPGHFANNCLEKKNLGVKKPAASPVERARAAGRVFALTSTEATKSGNLILEPCLLLGQLVLVLFDSGATHSFIANAYVGRLNLVKRNLGCELLVSTPFSSQVATFQSALGVQWKWQVANSSLVFPEHEGLELISARRAIIEVEAGATYFMVVAHVEKNNIAEKISVILVVEEYADVFPNEIPELPPSRDVDFTIDLIPGVVLVSTAPYRMAPA